MDEIHIDNLKIFAHHGVYDFENEKGQNFFVSAVLYTDLSLAGRVDDINSSTDYGEVCGLIKKIMTENTFHLIEACAQKVAVEILREFRLIKAVDVEICKPEAPIEEEFESVSVKIHRARHKAVVSLGSNMGDSEAFVKNAIREFSLCESIENLKESTLVKTRPYGYTEQADFINGVIIFDTFFSADELLKFMQALEKKAGRERKIHWGPRTLDLDLVFYDDKIISTENLTVPHPDMQNREFVLKPLCEVAPWYVHPVFHKRADILLKELEEKND